MEMHLHPPPHPPYRSLFAPPPQMKQFCRRCQALAAAAPGCTLLSLRRLSGCEALEIPWNPIQGFIPLALLAGALVSPSPLPPSTGKTDTQLEGLGGYSLVVDQL